MHIRRRHLLELAGASLLSSPAGAADFDWKRFAGKQLRFMVSVHPWTQWAQSQLPALERDTGIRVNWEILYEDQLRQKLPLTLRSDPGAVDGFFTLPSWDAAAFSRAGWYQPLDRLIQSDLTAPDYDYADFFRNILKIQEYDAVQIGIPITIELQALFVNKALLQAKGLVIPTTLEQLMVAARSLKDSANDVAGIVTRGDGVQAVYTFAPFLFAFGGRWQDEKGNPELATQPAIKALQYYGDLLRAAGPPNILGMQWKTTYPLFQQAHAAMFIDATNFLAYFKDPSQSRVVDQVAVGALPAGPAGEHSTVISWGPAIASSSRNKEATWIVIQYLTSKAAMAASTRATHLPPSRQSVYNSDIYAASVPPDMIAVTKAEIPNAIPNGANPLVIPVPEVRAAIGEAITAVLEGRNATEAANKMQKEVTQILNG
ncbi:MAG TPA: sugar ABC transporter substrate-binding protein [Acetobacteraceae bacterium]|nr:sugar ABC transporter substrate-binding protein [Acetobacteraceae bacterium]